MKKILKQMATQLEAIAASVAALETIIQSENYSGRQLTKRQLGKFVRDAKQEQKEVFDGLKALIQSLPAK